ncbi:TatD family hydrolase [Rheinheimera sp.]|uniref:TatD family hydrolase n=1 Tax=Rheinheimera sp. TaxID=1869214 RepID=UPI00307F7E18
MSIEIASEAGSTLPLLFDTHCHLDLPELLPQLEFHLQQACALGVQALLVPAVEQKNWLPLLALQQQFKFDIALGVHPWWASSAQLNALEQLPQLAAQPEVCAIGEIGLDYALDEATFAAQALFFSQQLAIAKALKKPVVLHHRKSMPQLLAGLKAQQFTEGGILHAFSGSYQQGKAFIDLGFKLGIGGTISYQRAEKTKKAVKKFPLDALVLETDAPAMPLSGFQGQVNTPAQLLLVFQALLELRSEPATQLAAQLWQNSCQVLRLNAQSRLLGSA